MNTSQGAAHRTMLSAAPKDCGELSVKKGPSRMAWRKVQDLHKLTSSNCHEMSCSGFSWRGWVSSAWILTPRRAS